MKHARPLPGRLAIAALTYEVGDASSAIQIMPLGEFRPDDGRPLDCGSWKLTPERADKIVKKAALRANRYVIDYEHQTQLAEKNGQPAPAAGWFKDLEIRPGEGLYAKAPEWTPRAKGYLEGNEYKYLSPVFAFDKVTGEVDSLVSVGLTNTPGLDGMDEVSLAALTARCNLADSAANPKEEKMNPVLKALLQALGLADSATETDAVSAVAALKAGAASVTALNTEIATLKANALDPAKYVPIEKVAELNTEIAALKAEKVDGQVDALITAAKGQGKVTPALEDTFRKLGKSDIAQLKAILDATPANPALAGQRQTDDKDPPKRGASDLSESELAMCKALNLTEEQFKAGATA